MINSLKGGRLGGEMEIRGGVPNAKLADIE